MHITQCCVVVRAGRGVLVEVRAEDGVTISQEDNDKQRRALFMRGKGTVQGMNQKQRVALFSKNGRKKPMKFFSSLRGHCKAVNAMHGQEAQLTHAPRRGASVWAPRRRVFVAGRHAPAARGLALRFQDLALLDRHHNSTCVLLSQA